MGNKERREEARQRILAVLADTRPQGWSLQELSAVLGSKPESFRNALLSLEEDSLVWRIREGNDVRVFLGARPEGDDFRQASRAMYRALIQHDPVRQRIVEMLNGAGDAGVSPKELCVACGSHSDAVMATLNVVDAWGLLAKGRVRYFANPPASDDELSRRMDACGVNKVPTLYKRDARLGLRPETVSRQQQLKDKILALLSQPEHESGMFNSELRRELGVAETCCKDLTAQMFRNGIVSIVKIDRGNAPHRIVLGSPLSPERFQAAQDAIRAYMESRKEAARQQIIALNRAWAESPETAPEGIQKKINEAKARRAIALEIKQTRAADRAAAKAAKAKKLAKHVSARTKRRSDDQIEKTARKAAWERREARRQELIDAGLRAPDKYTVSENWKKEADKKVFKPGAVVVIPAGVKVTICPGTKAGEDKVPSTFRGEFSRGGIGSYLKDSK